jgi:hypothetical protein
MAVPIATEPYVRDKRAQPVGPGDRVRLADVPEPADVQSVDPRYGVMIVLVPGRAGKMGRMVRGAEVERV